MKAKSLIWVMAAALILSVPAAMGTPDREGAIKSLEMTDPLLNGNIIYIDEDLNAKLKTKTPEELAEEQKELASKIEAGTARIPELNEEIADLELEIKDLESEIPEKQGELEELETALEPVAEQYNDYTANIEELNEVISNEKEMLDPIAKRYGLVVDGNYIDPKVADPEVWENIPERDRDFYAYHYEALTAAQNDLEENIKELYGENGTPDEPEEGSIAKEYATLKKKISTLELEIKDLEENKIPEKQGELESKKGELEKLQADLQEYQREYIVDLFAQAKFAEKEHVTPIRDISLNPLPEDRIVGVYVPGLGMVMVSGDMGVRNTEITRNIFAEGLSFDIFTENGIIEVTDLGAAALVLRVEGEAYAYLDIKAVDPWTGEEKLNESLLDWKYDFGFGPERYWFNEAYAEYYDEIEAINASVNDYLKVSTNKDVLHDAVKAGATLEQLKEVVEDPEGDFDGDGVPNKDDCDPFDPELQDDETPNESNERVEKPSGPSAPNGETRALSRRRG